ncbi:hypothetical protein N658DRAFT_521118 [Parathielavia hyrcaniae]|uniref:C2 domain-containing protein n=1 Tax=Parathielavia hyrcaniae TaxID=113614 RepID=A0AAN6QA11_9PEZI|nr:hypothetical protein N658DRAFT_521118 [Parathielavia hyrcaniae]
MTTKPKPHAINGMHTAGIFSDMSVDGPEIGTLVLVVDRAKNLPNRKTIGKQDPYCAARLGKEAKKTTTDIRGGQTPKWDQELRFTVHDSPDYLQIKVSVFNDDKRTELIGETWIDLRGIVQAGGGQSDQWHQLACRGKYAGEVRIEITFYDTRPKPEKPAVKAKPPAAAEPEVAPTGAAGPRPVPKRRPLPSDPITGKAPAQLSSGPDHQPPPPQQIEYNPAPPAQQYSHQADPGREVGTPSRRPDVLAQQHRTPDRAEPYPGQHDGYSPQYQQPGYDRRDSYDFVQANESRALEDDRPPPPPAHRSRTGSNPALGGTFQATPPTMRQEVLRSEAHRNSVSASYPGRPTYRAHDSAPAGLVTAQYAIADHGSPARHYSYDSAYEPHRMMQATVEDVPESPESTLRRTSGRWPHPQSQFQPQLEMDHDVTASPAPLTLSGRGSSESARYTHGLDPARYQVVNGYQMAPSEFPQRESPEYMSNPGRRSEPVLATHGANEHQMALTYRGQSEEPPNGYVPSMPASLIPGVVPNMANEISRRMSQDMRQPSQAWDYTQQALVETPPRGRTMGYSHDGSPAYGAPDPHNRSPVVYTNGPSTSSVSVVIKSRAYSPNPPRDPSPNPHRTIRRKSVSPRPPADTDRRLSGVPFGPDSYDELNPTASSAALRDPTSSRPDYDEASGKIITHDGREVDPSDHLPMETWAPEPEPKQPSSSGVASARPSPAGPQPAPPSSSRRPLRVAARPQSMLPASGSGGAITYSGSDHVEPATTPSAGRNRLQKKAAYRQSTSAIVPVMSGANGSGCGPGLGSSPGGGGNGFRRNSGGSDNFTPPRQIPRAATFDQGAGAYGSSPGSGHGGSNNHQHQHPHHYRSRSGGGEGFSSGGAPPIPAKVPLALPPPEGVQSGALQLHSSSVARRAGSGMDADDDGFAPHRHGHGHHGYGRDGGYGGGPGGRSSGGGGGGGALSLEEELRQIDIGTGRSSRKYGHGHGQAYAAGHGGTHGGGSQGGYIYGPHGGF